MPVRPASDRQYESMPSARARGRQPWTKATECQTAEHSERNPSQSALEALFFSREFLWIWFILSYPWACHRWHLDSSGETLTASTSAVVPMYTAWLILIVLIFSETTPPLTSASQTCETKLKGFQVFLIYIFFQSDINLADSNFK